MKNVILTSITVVLLYGAATAQQASRPALTDNLHSLHMNSLPINKVHVKAMRDFLKRDKEASNAEWMLIETGYVVKYTGKNNSRCRTVYNSRGAFAYTIRQYHENVMPRDVRGMVKSQYYDYAITLIEEIEARMKPLVYVVHLEDATTLKNVRVCEKEMEVVEEYKKTF
ncbi:hypothetical protein [Niastella populi]|uniref:Beta-lactamase-inhibitor-like PepSY-like domain-containing protein n=1 Tax=Niastella populi TaxID=550983 RepID=A0A1V9GBJ2_9BACT|nr:hypothetical protein [Niastella populi]OQP68029.1 hypothetical protein A4R26_11080 [Niastella populi]